jgi:hypothetical protein
MESQSLIQREHYISLMRHEVEELLGKVAVAVNEAPSGWQMQIDDARCKLKSIYPKTKL